MAIDGYGLGDAPSYITSALIKRNLNNNNKLIHSKIFPMNAVGDVGATGEISVAKYTANDGVYVDGKRATNALISESDIGVWSYLTVNPEEISDRVVTDKRNYDKMIGPGQAKTARGADELLWSDKVVKIGMKLEKQVEAAATLTTNYDANNLLEKGDKYWDSDAGFPLTDCTDVLNEMMMTCSQKPNIMWFAPDAWVSFTENVNVLARFASTSTKQVNVNWVLDYFKNYGIQEIVIGYASEKDSAGAMTPIWSDTIGFAHSTNDLSLERFGTNYVDNSKIILNKELTGNGKIYSHSGSIMSSIQVISDTAGGLITGINTP